MNQFGSRETAKKYSAIKVKLFIIDICVTLLALVCFQVLLSQSVLSFLASKFLNFYIQCLVFSGAFLFFLYILDLPIHFISSFIIERRFDLSNQNLKAWVLDEIKSVILSFVLSMGCILIFYLVLRNFESTWWLIVSFLWIFFTVILANLFPVLIIPLFFKYLPIDDPDLEKRILDLAGKSKIKIFQVSKIDFSKKTKKANAALVGLGSTRRVILSDTLLSDFTNDQIMNVVAHEFAHFKHRHIWKLLMFSSVMTLIGFFILSLIINRIVIFMDMEGVYDLRLFPVLIFLMTVSGIFLMPVQNFFSRQLEADADSFTLSTLNDPDNFISMMKRLADKNLADITPSKIKKIFLYDHPPIFERLQMAETFKKNKSLNNAKECKE